MDNNNGNAEGASSVPSADVGQGATPQNPPQNNPVQGVPAQPAQPVQEGVGGGMPPVSSGTSPVAPGVNSGSAPPAGPPPIAPGINSGSVPPNTPPTTNRPHSRKFLPAWDVVKKSFGLVFDNFGLTLIFIVFTVGVLILNFVADSYSTKDFGEPEPALAVVIALWVAYVFFELLFVYSFSKVFLKLTQGVQQTVSDIFRIDIARFLKMIAVYFIYILASVIPIFGLGFLGGLIVAATDISGAMLVVLYGGIILLAIVWFIVFATKYLFAPYVILDDENADIFGSFSISAKITAKHRVGLFLLVMFVMPVVALSGLIGFLIGVLVTIIVAYTIPLVAYRVLRAQTFNEPDGTSILQSTDDESSKDSRRILYGLCCLGMAIVVLMFSVVAWGALKFSSDTTERSNRVTYLHNLNAAMAIYALYNSEYPQPATAPNVCSTIDRGVLNELLAYTDMGDLGDEFIEENEVFYGAGIDFSTGKPTSYVIGTILDSADQNELRAHHSREDVDSMFGTGHGCECGSLEGDAYGYCLGASLERVEPISSSNPYLDDTGYTYP